MTDPTTLKGTLPGDGARAPVSGKDFAEIFTTFAEDRPQDGPTDSAISTEPVDPLSASKKDASSSEEAMLIKEVPHRDSAPSDEKNAADSQAMKTAGSDSALPAAPVGEPSAVPDLGSTSTENHPRAGVSQIPTVSQAEYAKNPIDPSSQTKTTIPSGDVSLIPSAARQSFPINHGAYDAGYRVIDPQISAPMISAAEKPRFRPTEHHVQRTTSSGTPSFAALDQSTPETENPAEAPNPKSADSAPEKQPDKTRINTTKLVGVSSQEQILASVRPEQSHLTPVSPSISSISTTNNGIQSPTSDTQLPSPWHPQPIRHVQSEKPHGADAVKQTSRPHVAADDPIYIKSPRLVSDAEADVHPSEASQPSMTGRSSGVQAEVAKPIHAKSPELMTGAEVNMQRSETSQPAVTARPSVTQEETAEAIYTKSPSLLRRTEDNAQPSKPFQPAVAARPSVLQVAEARPVAEPDLETIIQQVIRLKGAGPIPPEDPAITATETSTSRANQALNTEKLPAFTPPQSRFGQLPMTEAEIAHKVRQIDPVRLHPETVRNSFVPAPGLPRTSAQMAFSSPMSSFATAPEALVHPGFQKGSGLHNATPARVPSEPHPLPVSINQPGEPRIDLRQTQQKNDLPAKTHSEVVAAPFALPTEREIASNVAMRSDMAARPTMATNAPFAPPQPKDHNSQNRGARYSGVHEIQAPITPKAPLKAAAAPIGPPAQIPVFAGTSDELLKPLTSNQLDLLPAHRAEGGTPVAGAQGQILPTRTDLAAHVSRQIIEVAQHLPGRPVEIALSPEELGRVRLAVSSSDVGLIVHVSAERPETLDLLRRNINLLGEDFRTLGYEDVSFSFGTDTPPDQQGRSAPEDIIPFEDLTAPISAGPATPSSVTRKPMAPSGLDLRL